LGIEMSFLKEGSAVDPTTRAVVDEIEKRLGVVEARLTGLVDVCGPLGSSQASSTGNRAGRKNETAEIAAYAHQLRLEKKSWKKVWRLCQKRWPGSKHLKNKEQVRGIWRRHYGKKQKRID
jgi:hypothetical protein